MTDLSPAAQAVVNAVDHYETNHWLTPREVAAAALRAAALYCPSDRRILMTIAAELEALNDK
jgi:hypothetical protein